MLGVDWSASFAAELFGAPAEDDCAASLFDREDEDREEGAVDNQLDIEDPGSRLTKVKVKMR